ncbi:hypothetical protein AHF37_01069 [Paragonimus kellicotti]|nr:hypothetical protein AHF37_01069 [Paragonimus kellicotti]
MQNTGTYGPRPPTSFGSASRATLRLPTAKDSSVQQMNVDRKFLDLFWSISGEDMEKRNATCKQLLSKLVDEEKKVVVYYATDSVSLNCNT